VATGTPVAPPPTAPVQANRPVTANRLVTGTPVAPPPGASGGVIDYAKLTEAVRQGIIAGAARSEGQRRPNAGSPKPKEPQEQSTFRQLTSWLQRDSKVKDKSDPTKPAAAPARSSGGVTDLPVIGYLTKFFGGLVARVSGVLGPLGMLSTALSSASSGFSPFLSSVKVLGTLVGAMLAPFFLLLGVAVLTVVDYFADALLPVLGKYYSVVLQGAMDIAKGAKDMVDELPLIAEGLGEFVDELGGYFQSIYAKGKPLVDWLERQMNGYVAKKDDRPQAQGMQGNMIQRFYYRMFDWGNRNILGGEGYQTYKEQEGGSKQRGAELDKRIEESKKKQQEFIERQGGAVKPGMSPAEAAEARQKAESQGNELRAPTGGAPQLFAPPSAPPSAPPKDEGSELRYAPLPGQAGTPEPKLPPEAFAGLVQKFQGVWDKDRARQAKPDKSGQTDASGKPVDGAPGKDGKAGEKEEKSPFRKRLDLMMQEFRSQMAPKSQTSSLTGVVSAMQAAALNGSPLEKMALDYAKKTVDKLDTAVTTLKDVERKISPATTN
jgi:hypothetical protein